MIFYSFPSNGPHCNEKWLKTWASSEDNNALIFCIGGSCFSCLFVVFESLFKERMKGKHFLHIHHQHAIVLRYHTIEKTKIKFQFHKTFTVILQFKKRIHFFADAYLIEITIKTYLQSEHNSINYLWRRFALAHNKNL